MLNNISKHLPTELVKELFLTNLCTYTLNTGKAILALSVLTYFLNSVGKCSSPFSKTVSKISGKF